MSKKVYHYTTPEGVYSILKEKKLWFTDCQYLNDRSEFVYIREPFIEAYKKLCIERDESTKDIESFADYMCMASPYENYDWDTVSWDGGLKGRPMRSGMPLRYRYYVFCTSCNPDSTNMWNYYVKNGMYRGYNLGIDIKVLEKWFLQYSGENFNLVHGFGFRV